MSMSMSRAHSFVVPICDAYSVCVCVFAAWQHIYTVAKQYTRRNTDMIRLDRSAVCVPLAGKMKRNKLGRQGFVLFSHLKPHR